MRLSGLAAPQEGPRGSPLTVKLTIENTGNFDIEEVLQCYIRRENCVFAPPNHSLCAFKRVVLSKGESKEAELTIAPKAFTVVDDSGNRLAEAGDFHICVGVSQPDGHSAALCGVKPLDFNYTIR